ncbi:glucokinase [Thermosporothrix hazakensis]|jgi:glucokinase|uniref:Glucokinase n=2 Tax=Thermosporothrix TaxID=768650 RepID=A0A326UB12_THEHA|nr:ROK family protein [Thermosporothrix hazakensis]PZW33042.1 glucokinase [Thermosporothrix hazakensis]BBH91023.1 glucokinase [Thermosporothrix sp. COM3]GCE49074.1 glucokinase [Thermosporothrix hazakensis]
MAKQKAFALGIDLGGTKTLAAVIDVMTGNVIASARKRTRAERGADFVVQRVGELAGAALEEAGIGSSQKLVAIGVGAAGTIDRKAGKIINAPNLGVRDLAIGNVLAKKFNVPVSVGNDVEVAALGEYLYGAGKGYDNFVCVFIGTGIGSGIVREGKMYTGATGTAGEVGHMVVDAFGRICGCGARGCLEAYASRTAITRAIMAEIHHGRSSVLAEDAQKQLKQGDTIIRSGILADAIQKKDELTIEIVKEAGEYLGIALGGVMNFYNPECIVLGGGVIEAIDLLYNTAVRRAYISALPGPVRKTPIHKAKLGDFSGVVGAACLAAQAAGYTIP